MQITDTPQEKKIDSDLDNNSKEGVPSILIVSENCFSPFFSVPCLEMTTKRKIIGRLVPCRCFRGEEEIVSVLDYSHCGLQQVPKEVFNFERTLEELYLDANQIEELPKVIHVLPVIQMLKFVFLKCIFNMCFDSEIVLVHGLITCLPRTESGLLTREIQSHFYIFSAFTEEPKPLRYHSCRWCCHGEEQSRLLLLASWNKNRWQPMKF